MELSMKLLGNKFTFGKSVTVSIGDQKRSLIRQSQHDHKNHSLSFRSESESKTPASDPSPTPHQELDDDDDDRQHVPPGPSSSSSGSNKQDDADEDEKMKKIATFRDEVDDPDCFLGLMLSSSSRHADVIVHNPQPLQSVSPSSSSPSADGRKKRKRSSTTEHNKRLKHENYPQVPTTDLSPELVEEIGQTVVGPVFLYRKKLTDTDINRNQNRLLVTVNKKLVDEFLTKQEKEAYDVDEKDKEKPRPRIDAFAVDGKKGSEYHLHLLKWNGNAVLIHKWGDLVAENKAKTGDWVDLWGFVAKTMFFAWLSTSVIRKR